MASTRGGPQRIPRPPTARPGGAPPWSGGADPADLDLTIAAIARRLAARASGARADERPDLPARRSAVMVPLYESEGDTWVVLTRRSPHLRSHSFEIAFPGGRIDPDDPDAWSAAVREAHEEIGLEPGLARRIGELDGFVTVGSASAVQPFVAALPGSPVLRASPDEVDRLIQVRLADLLRPEIYREELWPIDDVWRTVSFFDLVGDTVWGATGAMLRQFLSIAAGAGDPGLGR